MATSPDSDVVPVRKETKRRLDALRAGRTYDAVLRDLLDGRLPSPPVASKERHPDEQVALARLAATRWRLSVEEGRIVELGPRLVAWNAPKEDPQDGVRYTWVERRGLSA